MTRPMLVTDRCFLVFVNCVSYVSAELHLSWRGSPWCIVPREGLLRLVRGSGVHDEHPRQPKVACQRHD